MSDNAGVDERAAPASTGFVGRHAELADLTRVLDRVRLGRGGFGVVVGEPGMGKTAMVEEAVRRSGLPVVWARTRDDAGTPPLWLWDQVRRGIQGLGWAGDHARQRDAAGPSLAGTGQERFRRFDLLARVLTDHARVRPYVIALDDLQWADAESAAMLDFLAPDVADVPLVVIATTRLGDGAVPARADPVIELRGLASDELRELLSDHVGGAVSDDLVDAVERYTGGSPFFVGEVARLLHSAGHASDPAHWRGVVPEGVRAVLVRRLARLPQLSHDALAAAAVVGADFDATVVAAMLGADRADTHDRLGPAVRAGLLHETADGRFRFAHALVHDAVRAEIGSGRRRQLHERAAEILATLSGDRAAPAIAAHLAAAGDGAGARRWAERAGDIAYRAAMYVEAAEWYGRAVGTGDDVPLGMALRLADALSRSGQVRQADERYVAVARLARVAGDDDAFARAALGVGTLGGGFEVRLLEPMQLALLREALSRLGPSDSTVRVLLTARLSVASSLGAGHEERAALADDAVAMARRVGDDGALAYALSAWCDAHAGPADVDRRLAAGAEMLEAAVRSGDPELELLARRFRIVASMERGDVANASREATQFSRLADSLRQPQFRWYGRLVEGMLAFLRGDMDEATRLGQVGAELGRQAASANAEMLCEGTLLPVVARERGDATFAEMLAVANAAHPEATRGLDILPLFAIGYGADRAAVERCVGELEGALVDAHDGLYLLVRMMYGEAAILVGDRAAMARAAADLDPFADLLVMDGTAAVCHGPVATTLGRLAAARGDREAAVAYLERSAATLRRMGAPLLLARVEAELAAIGAAAGAAVAPAGDATVSGTAALTRDGEVWSVSWAGESTRLRHSKGLTDLSVLLARPGVDVHVFDLVAVADGGSASDRPRGGGAGPVLDATARAAYERRIVELTSAIEAAEARHDDDRAARLDAERHELLRELSSALGLGGRPRQHGSDVERARKAVGMRLRDTIARLERELPALGHHLRHSVQMGTQCTYRPEHPVVWHCQP